MFYKRPKCDVICMNVWGTTGHEKRPLRGSGGARGKSGRKVESLLRPPTASRLKDPFPDREVCTFLSCTSFQSFRLLWSYESFQKHNFGNCDSLLLWSDPKLNHIFAVYRYQSVSVRTLKYPQVIGHFRGTTVHTTSTYISWIIMTRLTIPPNILLKLGALSRVFELICIDFRVGRSRVNVCQILLYILTYRFFIKTPFFSIFGFHIFRPLKSQRFTLVEFYVSHCAARKSAKLIPVFVLSAICAVIILRIEQEATGLKSEWNVMVIILFCGDDDTTDRGCGPWSILQPFAQIYFSWPPAFQCVHVYVIMYISFLSELAFLCLSSFVPFYFVLYIYQWKLFYRYIQQQESSSVNPTYKWLQLHWGGSYPRNGQSLSQQC